jgi:hypothetical protein
MKAIKHICIIYFFVLFASVAKAQNPITVACSASGTLVFQAPFGYQIDFNNTLFYFGNGDSRNGTHSPSSSFYSGGSLIPNYTNWIFNSIPCITNSLLNVQITLEKTDKSYVFLGGSICPTCSDLSSLCPSSLTCSLAGFLAMQYSEDVHPIVNPITVYLGPNDPNNGIYTMPIKTRGGAVQVDPSGVPINSYLYSLSGPPCNEGTLQGQVTLLIDGQVCTYENGSQVPNTNCEPFGSYFIENDVINSYCVDFFENCLPDLIDLIHANASSLPCRQWDEYSGSSCSVNSSIWQENGVSIGTSGHSNSKLTVKDGIITDKVKVESCGPLGWCDYVFEEDYFLPKLEQVAAFIEKNKRLPNVPSGSTLEKEQGFDLKEITLLHQEKIEEIFLYMIALEKEADRLEELLVAKKGEK